MQLAYPLELFRHDFARHVEFLKNCTVEHVPLYFMLARAQREQFFGAGASLSQMVEIFPRQVAEIRSHGLKIEVIYAGGEMATTVLDSPIQQSEFKRLCRVCTEQSIRVIGLMLPNPDRAQATDTWMDNLVRGYQWLAKAAAAYDLKICSHNTMGSGRRFYTPEDFEELLARIDRDNCGLLFCFGNFALAELDVPEMIWRFRDYIFAVHLRQVQGSFGQDHEETQFHNGIVDLPACLQALQKIGCQGILHPEHFPRFSTALSSDQRDLWQLELEPDGPTLAWTLGYVRGLMNTVL